MKLIYNKSKYGLLIASLLMLFFSSCAEDYPSNVESDKEVVLKSIRIVNAGADGNMVVEGRVDENSKTVWFPRLDPATDVSALTTSLSPNHANLNTASLAACSMRAAMKL